MTSNASISLILLVGVLIQLTLSHPLLKLSSRFPVLAHHYSRGDTSHAFSIAMGVKVAVDQLATQMNITSSQPIHLEHELVTSHFGRIPNTCQGMLEAVAKWSQKGFVVEHFEVVKQVIDTMASKCTNADFSFGSIQEDSETQQQKDQWKSGFQNRCALCTILLRVWENYARYYKKDITRLVQHDFCSLLDGILKPTCQAFVHYFGGIVIEVLTKALPSDLVCLKIGYCKDPNCRLSKAFSSNGNSSLQDALASLQLVKGQFENKPAPWEWLVHLFVDKFGDKHLPPFDLDNDTFSSISTFRGYDWRGADCDQLDAKIYPGRKTGSKLADHDCNGILGKDKEGTLYEDKLCAGYKRMGVAVIGDSAGAHFSIPEKYMNVSMMVKGSFNDFLSRVANQLDIPYESAYTGHVNTTYESHSIYKYLRKWNMCNHNDYQNTGVNGGDSGNTEGNMKALRRDPKNDYPLLMFMELIGNDVCKDSFDRMRKPEDFKANILKLLTWLDSNVPAGSHLTILGLADGDILYDNLHDSIHPLNVTYSQIYDFLNCLKISPCWGWLNSNETVRKFTTQRAQNLSLMYKQIISEGHTFRNFDIVYYDFPIMDILARKVSEGGDPKNLIERCDGFHPNVEFNSYLADWLWDKINREHPSWIGAENPNNDQIRKIFGHKIIL